MGRRGETTALAAAPLTVIVAGTDVWVIALVAGDLERRGHNVLRCHDPEGPSFPCVGLAADSACPVDTGADVIVTARAHPIPQPARREVAVTCAVRGGVPLIVAGNTILHPFGSVVTAVVEGFDDVEAACVDVVRRYRPEGPEGRSAEVALKWPRPHRQNPRQLPKPGEVHG